MKQPPQLRRVGISSVLLASTAIFAVVVHQHVPLQSWLFFRYALTRQKAGRRPC
jgi:hypothetical protein